MITSGQRLDCKRNPLHPALELRCVNRVLSVDKSLRSILTFIVRMSVLRAMSNMIKYSNGLESTIVHMRYCHVLGSSGMNLSEGLATIAK